MPRLLALLAVAAVVTAGCLGPPPAEGPNDADAVPPPADGDGPGPDARDAAGDPADPTAKAPAWTPGTWWRWTMTGRNFGSYELTTVVARTGPDAATVAFTEVEPGLRSHIFHVPPLGEVRTSDLAWTVHGEPADLVDFPLSDGKTWTGSFEGREVAFEATAVEREGRTVFEVNGTYVEFDGQGPRYVYDPALGTFAELHLHYGGATPFSSARVVGHGTDHGGVVHLPWAEDKFLGGAGFPGVPDPVRSFEAAQDKQWLVFACYLGGTAGRYEIAYVPPSPAEDPLRCSFRNDGATFDNDVQVLWRSSVPGDWTVGFGVVGAGYAEAEVVGVWDEVCRVGPTAASDGGPADAPACA